MVSLNLKCLCCHQRRVYVMPCTVVRLALISHTHTEQDKVNTLSAHGLTSVNERDRCYSRFVLCTAHCETKIDTAINTVFITCIFAFVSITHSVQENCYYLQKNKHSDLITH